jgi:hypothetical protein
MYLAQSANPNRELFAVDKTSGINSVFPNAIITFSSADISGLEVLPDGTMLALDSGPADRLFQVNKATGVGTLVGTLGHDFGTAAGLAFDADLNTLFAVESTLFNGPSTLYRVDRFSGAATVVGPTGFVDFTGLAVGPGATTPVPEPSTFAHFAILVFGFAAHRIWMRASRRRQVPQSAL